MQYKVKAIFGIIVFSLLSSHAAWAGDLIIESLLPTAPPGYVIEKSYGNILITEYEGWSGALFDNVSKGVNEAIAKADKKLSDYVTKKLGANAILAEKIDVQTTPGQGTIHIIAIVQGEAVILKKADTK
jgi:uncharacterized protein YbjQ (UPF0145 family)